MYRPLRLAPERVAALSFFPPAVTPNMVTWTSMLCALPFVLLNLAGLHVAACVLCVAHDMLDRLDGAVAGALRRRSDVVVDGPRVTRNGVLVRRPPPPRSRRPRAPPVPSPGGLPGGNLLRGVQIETRRGGTARPREEGPPRVWIVATPRAPGSPRGPSPPFVPGPPRAGPSPAPPPTLPAPRRLRCTTASTAPTSTRWATRPSASPRCRPLRAPRAAAVVEDDRRAEAAAPPRARDRAHARLPREAARATSARSPPSAWGSSRRAPRTSAAPSPRSRSASAAPTRRDDRGGGRAVGALDRHGRPLALARCAPAAEAAAGRGGRPRRCPADRAQTGGADRRRPVSNIHDRRAAVGGREKQNVGTR